ncbi:hypothetical protein N9544_07980 [Flavobacteriales bacterium]|nr:hypothetical protein [Flavobacteriales bacterium]
MYKFLPNYDEHPSKSNYMVFTFRNPKMADYFEKELVSRGIQYESDEDDSRRGMIFYFGVKKADKEEVYKLNLITHGKFRKPFFGNLYLRIVLTTILVGLVTLAIIGFIKN